MLDPFVISDLDYLVPLFVSDQRLEGFYQELFEELDLASSVQLDVKEV